MPGVAIEIEHVSRRFELGGEEVWALRDVTLSVAPQEFLAVIGRSGSGKTTLLNLIAGLDHASEGAIRIDGQDLTSFSEHQLTDLRRKRIGFIFQSFGLLPLLSAQENVELALRIAGAGRRDRVNRSHEVLAMMGLGKRANHRPYELSGGEQQRVAIARAIANRPALILADEPTGELDSITAVSIFRLLREVARSEGITIITSTHDRTVMELATRVEELADGRLRASGHRDLLSYVAERGGHLAAADGELQTAVPAGAAVAAAQPPPASPAATTAPKETKPPVEAEPAADPNAWALPERQIEPVHTAEQSPEATAGEAAAKDVDWPLDETPEEELSRWAPPERRS